MKYIKLLMHDLSSNHQEGISPAINTFQTLNRTGPYLGINFVKKPTPGRVHSLDGKLISTQIKCGFGHICRRRVAVIKCR